MTLFGTIMEYCMSPTARYTAGVEFDKAYEIYQAAVKLAHHGVRDNIVSKDGVMTSLVAIMLRDQRLSMSSDHWPEEVKSPAESQTRDVQIDALLEALLYVMREVDGNSNLGQVVKSQRCRYTEFYGETSKLKRLEGFKQASDSKEGLEGLFKIYDACAREFGSVVQRIDHFVLKQKKYFRKRRNIGDASAELEKDHTVIKGLANVKHNLQRELEVIEDKIRFLLAPCDYLSEFTRLYADACEILYRAVFDRVKISKIPETEIPIDDLPRYYDDLPDPWCDNPYLHQLDLACKYGARDRAGLDRIREKNGKDITDPEHDFIGHIGKLTYPRRLAEILAEIGHRAFQKDLGAKPGGDSESFALKELQGYTRVLPE